MKVDVYTLDGKKDGVIELPPQFGEPVREDLIRRAVLAIQSHRYQSYGTNLMAGKRQGKATPKRRRKYGTTYGYGISRIKRKRLWVRGGRFGWVGAFVASAVGGLKAFPPKVEKIIKEKINKKERRKAIRSALAAAANFELVSSRHKLEKRTLPIVIESKFEKLAKTKDVLAVLKALKLEEELKRAAQKKVRAGRGKMRGRRYRRKIGPLIIVSSDCPLLKAATNIPGVDIVQVKNLNAELLAPGTQPARFTIWSKAAMEKLAKEKLFS